MLSTFKHIYNCYPLIFLCCLLAGILFSLHAHLPGLYEVVILIWYEVTAWSVFTVINYFTFVDAYECAGPKIEALCFCTLIATFLVLKKNWIDPFGSRNELDHCLTFWMEDRKVLSSRRWDLNVDGRYAKMGEVCVLLLHCLWIWTYADLLLLNIPLCFTVLSNIFIVHWMYSFSVMLDFSSIFRTGIKLQCGRVFILYIVADSDHFRLASKLCVVF